MKHWIRRLKWKIILGWFAIHGWIVCHAQLAARLPLTSAMVVEALHVRGVEVNAANVHLPMLLYVAAPSSALAITGAERETGDRLRVRLRCIKVSDCVAFTATLNVERPEAEAILALTKATVPVPADGDRLRLVVRLHAGDPVALSIQQEHLQVKMPCLAIDTGAVGETIRVSTLDHRKIFRAIVTGPSAATGVSE
jgi:hypothetical protein